MGCVNLHNNVRRAHDRYYYILAGEYYKYCRVCRRALRKILCKSRPNFAPRNLRRRFGLIPDFFGQGPSPKIELALDLLYAKMLSVTYLVMQAQKSAELLARSKYIGEYNARRAKDAINRGANRHPLVSLKSLPDGAQNHATMFAVARHIDAKYRGEFAYKYDTIFDAIAIVKRGDPQAKELSLLEKSIWQIIN